MKKIIYFFFICCSWLACKNTSFVELPTNLEDEKPIFYASANIEGRSTPIQIVAGEQGTRMELIFSAFSLPSAASPSLDTKLGALSFTYPFTNSSDIIANKNRPFVEDTANTIDYIVTGQEAFFLNFSDKLDISIDDSLVLLNNNMFQVLFPYPPKKIDIRLAKDSNIYQTYFNPAEGTPMRNLAIIPQVGISVSSTGASTFKWSTGSSTPVTLIDSSATSKYYCVTTTGTALGNRVEACASVTKLDFNTFLLEANNWLINVTPRISFNSFINDWIRLSFTDQDGAIYLSELGIQPSSSFFIIDKITPYTAPDFRSFLSNVTNPNTKTTLLKLDIRFDCVLFTPYGKKLHLQNGKGTILIQSN